MHHSPTYSANTKEKNKERKAHQLWGQFTRRDQEGFWQQYEKLIVKNPQQFTSTQAPSQTLAQPPKVVAIQPRSFHNRLLPYRVRLVFFTVNLGLMGIFLVNVFFSVHHKPAFSFLAALVFFYTIRPLWYFTSLYISNQHLLVLRDLLLRKKSFAWSKIHLIELYRDQYKTAYIKVWLRSNEQQCFKYPLVGRNHHKFLQVLEHKNIFVENRL
ncbi:MAG TPA: hypothetical protein DCS93_15825 [Microscillaceae bacterium]|nr:hypothetical protein [Microscillaceae bacterium]